MPRPFHDEIVAVMKQVEDMGLVAKGMLLDGVKSFAEVDVDLARDVVARNDHLNRLDVTIEKQVLDLVTRHQPMGKDVRRLGASLKIITYLDRIGRYGFDIAHSTLAMEGRSHIRRLVTIPHMAHLASEMLDDALGAYVGDDAAKARGVFPKDEVVDALYDQTFRESVTYVMEDPRTMTVVAQYILVCRHLERAADNAMKIAEKSLYMSTGERRLEV